MKNGTSLPWAVRDWFKLYQNKPGDHMIKQLLNSFITKYCDLSMSHRLVTSLCLRLWQIIDLLAPDKSQYFAQPRPIIVIYYTFNSLTLFWLSESLQWVFEISARDVITADYTIIMSRSLKAMGYHVMYDRSAWFLRVIMSNSRALCCLPSVKKQKHFFFVQCIIKQLLDSVFVISRIIKVSVRLSASDFGFGW